MSDINCPYCAANLEICHDDGFGFEEDVAHQMECYECEKYFVFYTSIMYCYHAEPAECLNDGNHVWAPTNTYPRKHTRMYCTLCDEYRPCTDEEKTVLGYWS
jgi:hypothetical protein